MRTGGFPRRAEHGTKPRPFIVPKVIRPIVKCIPGYIGQSIPQVPFRIQQLHIHVRPAQNFRFSVFLSEKLRIRPFDLPGKRNRRIPPGGQHRHVRMIGDHGINDNDHILPVRADKNAFHHRVTVLVITADDDLLKPLETDMIGHHLSLVTIGQHPADGSYERHLPFFFAPRFNWKTLVSPTVNGRTTSPGLNPYFCLRDDENFS